MSFIYITIEQAIVIHKKTVEISGGGLLGKRVMGILEGVLGNMQNDDYYPTFEEKLTHLFFSTCNFHCFEDGNKRISISLGTQFLLLNGYLLATQRFFPEMENISFHVANGNIDKDLLHDIICALIKDELESEEIKLKILNAIT